jgi:hypothetical protein
MNAPISNTVNLQALRVDVRRAVATAKIAEFEQQAFRLGGFVATGELERGAVADLLLDVAIANGLPRTHGGDVIQSILANGLDCK